MRSSRRSTPGSGRVGGPKGADLYFARVRIEALGSGFLPEALPPVVALGLSACRPPEGQAGADGNQSRQDGERIRTLAGFALQPNELQFERIVLELGERDGRKV